MADENQQVLEMLSQANVSRQQWDVATPKPSQTPDALSAGLLASMSSQLQQMQNMQMQQLNAQLSQQNYLRAYSQAMPGVPAPVQIYQDPTVSNYALQNMYQMNPYMANFFGQNQGAPSMMGMAPPSFMTSPRMGIFRGTRYDQQGRPITSHGLMSDIGALTGRSSGWWSSGPMSVFPQRTFAPFEDPIDETIEARRRMFRRGESLTGAAITAADVLTTAGAMYAGVGAGLAIGTASVAMVPIAVASGAYFQRRAETNRINDISRSIATGANAGGFRNQGFSLGESAQMMQQMRRDSAADPFYNMSDYMNVFQAATQSGMFAFKGNAKQTETQMKGIISTLDTFMRLAGDSDVQGAIQRMATLQTMGLTQPEMIKAIQGMRGLANLAGTSVSQMMSTSGAYGAQVATQMGTSPMMGMIAGGVAQSATRSMVQRGHLTPTELAIRGGEEGVTQSLTQIITNAISTGIEQRLAGMMGLGGGRVNPNATLMDSYQAIGKMTRQELFTYQRELKDNAATVAAAMSPVDQISYLRNQLKELKGIYGSSLSEDEILYSRHGENWKTFKYMLSKDYAKDLQAQQMQAQATLVGSESEKALQRGRFWNRVGTSISGYFEDVGWQAGQLMGGYEGRARSEQSKAMAAAGFWMPASGGFSGTDEQKEALLTAFPDSEIDVPTSRTANIRTLRESGSKTGSYMKSVAAQKAWDSFAGWEWATSQFPGGYSGTSAEKRALAAVERGAEAFSNVQSKLNDKTFVKSVMNDPSIDGKTIAENLMLGKDNMFYSIFPWNKENKFDPEKFASLTPEQQVAALKYANSAAASGSMRGATEFLERAGVDLGILGQAASLNELVRKEQRTANTLNRKYESEDYANMRSEWSEGNYITAINRGLDATWNLITGDTGSWSRGSRNERTASQVYNLALEAAGGDRTKANALAQAMTDNNGQLMADLTKGTKFDLADLKERMGEISGLGDFQTNAKNMDKGEVLSVMQNNAALSAKMLKVAGVSEEAVKKTVMQSQYTNPAFKAEWDKLQKQVSEGSEAEVSPELKKKAEEMYKKEKDMMMASASQATGNPVVDKLSEVLLELKSVRVSLDSAATSGVKVQMPWGH